MRLIRPIYDRLSLRRGLTLFELLLAIAIGVVLMWLLVNSVIKARQRALVAALVEDGGRTDLYEDGSVRMLDLSSVSAQDLGDNLKRMSRLDGLYALNLDHTPVTRWDLEDVFQPMDLAQLHLCGTQITDDAVEVIVSQPRLNLLDVRATFLSDEGIGRLVAKLPHIRNLRLSETWITDAGVKHLLQLPDLQILDLRVTDISDASIETIRQMTSLKTVRLNGTRVTEEGAKALKRSRPELRIEFTWPRVRYREFVGIRAIRQLDSNQQAQLLLKAASAPVNDRMLSQAHIFHCSIGDEMPPEVMQRLPRLRVLTNMKITASWLKAEHLAELWKNHRLQDVTLTGPAVTDDVLPMLARCRSLHYLDLSHTNITGEQLSELQHCLALYQLDLGYTDLSDEGIEQLATLTSSYLQRVTVPMTSQDPRLHKLLSLTGVWERGMLWLKDGRFSGRNLRKLRQRLEAEAETTE